MSDIEVVEKIEEIFYGVYENWCVFLLGFVYGGICDFIVVVFGYF